MSKEAGRLKWQRATSGFERARLNLLVALITLTVDAWALTLHQALEMSALMDIAVRGGVTSDGMGGMAMAGMPAGGWSFAGAISFGALWTVMMAAMMFPAAAPSFAVDAQ
jgi:predicted metal-binding membrane protein